MASPLEPASLEPASHSPGPLQPNEVAAWRRRWQEGHTPWNLGEAAPELVSVLGSWQVAGRALVPGCGHGHEVSLLEDLGWSAVGLDVAPEALAAACKRDPRPLWHCGDVLNPPPHWRGTFDLVVEHTCFCALPPRCRPTYAQAVRDLLQPGGHFLGLFWCHQQPDGPPFGSTPQELNHCFGDLLHLISLREAHHSVEQRWGEEWLGHWQGP